MSPSTERGGRRPADDGSTLVEVVVAIGIVALLLVATLPALIGGIGAGDVARRATQAKSIAMAEMERLRNLPFWVARNAGEFIDVLDRYYTDQTAPSAPPACGTADALTAPAATAAGYVAPTAARCSWEPAGPLYRTVRHGSAATGDAGFVVVVDVQLLTDSTPPTAVTPPAGWTTQEVDRDRPPARQIGATVTVFPEGRAVRVPVQSHTQVSRREEVVTRVRAGVDVTALQVGTSVRAGGEVPLNATAGVLRLGSSLTYASTVDAVLSAVAASIGTGQQARGATSTVSAPPTTTAPSQDLLDGALDSSGCDLVCWGGSRVSDVTVSAASGLPNAGSPSQPLSVAVKEPSAEERSFRMAAGTGAAYRPELKLDGPLVRMRKGAVGSATSSSCTTETSGTNVRVGASGWLRTTGSTDATAPYVVDACGTARTSSISLLPTTFAPYGVVRVQLSSASARCLVSGAGHAGSTSVDYEALVWRWVPDTDPTHDIDDDYQLVATVRPSTTTDLLAEVPLATTEVPGHGVLGDWIAAWSSITPAGVRRVAGTGAAEVTVPGVVTVLTRPLRHQTDDAGAVVLAADGSPVVEETSTLSLTAGSLTCRAEDAR